ncbi:MAG: hypothetical protein RLY95_4 [Pseudomonadota bacterium]|jgi:hypothetical protein
MNSCEWLGTGFGLFGALLLATNSRISQYGWLAYLLANIFMIVFAASIGAHGLLVQQCGFLITTVIGIFRCRPLPPSLGVKT